MEKIEITGIGSELQGVGRLLDGRAVFVRGALPGETVNIEIIQALSCLRHDADRTTAISNLQSFAASLLDAQYPLGYFP